MPFRIKSRRPRPATLRADYFRHPALRKSCAICGKPEVQLHHAQYNLSFHALTLLCLVPLCSFHHDEFEQVVFPRLKSWMGRTLATLVYVVHGDRIHWWLNPITDGDPPRPGASRNQLVLWGSQSPEVQEGVAA
jgi:hypothetical protein